MNRAVLCIVCLVLFAMPVLSHRLHAAPPSKDRPQVGRYQLAAGFTGTIYVIDTATGRCWSKVPDGRWVDEGNPSKQRPERPQSPLSLSLPKESLELTIIQRRSKAIPGSRDRIMLQLGDITAGQVLLSVRSDDAEVLLDDVSVKQGDVVKFVVAKNTFYIRVRELKNVLVGDDFGIIEISSSPPETKPAKEARVREGNRERAARNRN